MSVADDLYDSIRGYLRVVGRLLPREGQTEVNVGERFKIRFTGSNTCPQEWVPWWKQPDVIFDNPRILVEGTVFAEPVAGNAWHRLPDTRLRPGEASYVDVEFEAKLDFGYPLYKEHVAKVFILGELDQDRFFRVWNYTETFVPIEPT